ncbi:cell death-inducing p53-target protein 1 homolog isoform X2 [Pomacea canaliculata]|uniref:cell death-inducing p53-target protein 1 homolog isoform X2 n=1 Tax=Pomacea canaliculata TaxID=400727 RepID=UPI000D737B21|nr:cell death-inducing p53-target protein 1 homolog isoform X2 [Pomacea canaliculata]
MSAPPPPYPGTDAAYPPPPPGPGYPPDPKMGGPAPGYPQGYGQPPYGQPAYGQPAYGQPAFNQSGQTTVVVAQPQLTIVQTFRESPVHTRCPHCQAEILTGTHYETGTFTWIVCLILCLVGCDLGCCLIPFCVDSCKDVVHTCPNCRQQVSRWSRM